MKIRLLITGPLLFFMLALASCSKDGLNDPRKEYFEVHALADCSDEPLTSYCVGVMKGESELFIKTNLNDFKIFWQDAASTPWLRITGYEKISPSVWRVKIQYDHRSSGVHYGRRSGTLSITKPSESLGMFLSVHQGATERTTCDFSDFKYGSWNPLSADGEMHISKWSDGLRKKGFSSEPVAPATESSCVSKYGYLKIGDQTSKGNLLTPVNGLHRYDSLLMVTFKAAVYPGDDRSFEVEVVGGGVIRDFASEGKTKMTLETADIISSAVTPEGLWPAQSKFVIFIAGTQTNKVGVNTCIKITSGASGKSGGARLFFDDLCVMKLAEDQDIDYFAGNQGSGQDKMLAIANR